MFALSTQSQRYKSPTKRISIGDHLIPIITTVTGFLHFVCEFEEEEMTFEGGK
jgi:hypothetical protein